MIGQEELKETLQSYKKNFPRFLILVGNKGSGRKLLCYWIAKELGAFVTICGTTIDDIRHVTSTARFVVDPTIYVFADADKMSPSAKNALLKITEEPPNNAYFVLTLTDLNNTLPTIQSRGRVLYMMPYTDEQLLEYCDKETNLSAHEKSIARSVCTTPGEIETASEAGIAELYEYAQKVVDMIATVSGANAFKISHRMKMKDTDTTKFDIAMFFRAFNLVCASRFNVDYRRYSIGIMITTKYLQDLRVTGINKAQLFDMWMLDIRKVWM